MNRLTGQKLTTCLQKKIIAGVSGCKLAVYVLVRNFRTDYILLFLHIKTHFLKCEWAFFRGCCLQIAFNKTNRTLWVSALKFPWGDI